MDTLVVTKRSQLTDIADAIRAKTGKSDEITLNDMPNEINEIGGGDKGFCYVDIESKLPNNVEVMVNISASVSVEDGGKYYAYALYNGVRLPRIPDSVLASYPYAWIRENSSTGYYDLALTKIMGYYNPAAGTSNGGIVYGENNTTTDVVQYRISITNAGTATAWEYNQTTNAWMGLDSNRILLWSNHDIPNGSATATDIYFNESEPVLTD
jgi:hypothetical protein